MRFQNYTSQQKIEFKSALKKECLHVLEQRIKTAQTAMNDAQDSANNEDKSSAGDKYETARAMGQLDRDMNAKQFAEAQQEHLFLQSVNVENVYDKIQSGSVAISGDKLFFISVGLGILKMENENVICLSRKSPLFHQLKQKSVGDTFQFQDKILKIETVF